MEVRLLPPTFGRPLPAPRGERVAVMMSGGVDSSVSALILMRGGYDVVGVTMRLPPGPSGKRPCCGDDAAFVCARLGLPHVYLDSAEAFTRLVVEPFRRDYALGLTPSPCIDCNTRLKFGAAWDALEREFGPVLLATGHYAVAAAGRLFRAPDRARDQSYFLYGIPSRRLQRLILPVASMSKEDVRAEASAAGLHVARKPDSQELCFAGERDYRKALGDDPRPGPILNVSGRHLGNHGDIRGFTIGQRKGLRLGGGTKLYVIAVRPEDAAVIVGPREIAFARHVKAKGINILAPDSLSAGARLAGKIRSVGEPAACTVTHLGEKYLEVSFDEPVFAPAPGQHLVLYDENDAVVAGGVISSSSSC